MPKGPVTSPRLQDVAEAAGVSIATASRSLSGATGVSEPVAERVRETARTMGYVVNLHARSLAGGASRSVGLLVHEIGDPYFSEIASGVLGVGAREGLTVQICHTGRDPERELAQLRMLIANRVGAIIIAGSGIVDPSLQAAGQGRAAGVPALRRAGGRHRSSPPRRRRRAARQHRGRPLGRPAPARPRAPADRRRGRLAPLTTVADRIAGVGGGLHRCRVWTSATSRSSRPTSPAPAARSPPRRSCPPTPTSRRCSPSTTTWPSASCRRCAPVASRCPVRSR